MAVPPAPTLDGELRMVHVTHDPASDAIGRQRMALTALRHLAAASASRHGLTSSVFARDVFGAIISALHGGALRIVLVDAGGHDVVLTSSARRHRKAPVSEGARRPNGNGAGRRTIAVPIGPDRRSGEIRCEWHRPAAPDKLDLVVMRAAAAHLFAALEHTALRDRCLKAERQQVAHVARHAALAHLARRMRLGLSLDRALEQAAALVHDTLRVDYCEVLGFADTNSLLLRAGAGWPPGEVGRARVAAGPEFMAGYTLRRSAPVILADVARESRFAPTPLLRRHGVVSGMTVVIDGEQHPVGVLGAHARVARRFSSEDVHFLQAVAHLIAAGRQRHRAEARYEAVLRQAKHAVTSRDRVMGIVSHDLGNSLATVQICAAALLDPEPPPLSSMRHMAQMIQRSAGWMQQIVQDLLDRTKLESGHLVTQLRPTEVADVIGAAQEMFAPLAQEREIHFGVESATELPIVNADRTRLLQVLTNLLSNAMKFTSSGGRVVLGAHGVPLDARASESGPASPRAAVRFAVTDTGCGIPAEDLDHVFDWFWHAPRSERGGTGLGLAIARGLVEAHGSHLHVVSVPGKGSRFWFTLPAASMAC